MTPALIEQAYQGYLKACLLVHRQPNGRTHSLRAAAYRRYNRRWCARNTRKEA